MPLPAWQRGLVAISAFKIAIALVATLFVAIGNASVGPPDLALKFAHVVVYGGAGWVLLAGGARDRRAVHLGIVFLCTASVFADPVMAEWIRAGRPVAGVIGLVFVLQPDAMTPYFLWRFAGQFPRGPDFGVRHKVVRGAARASLVVGVLLFALNLLRVPWAAGLAVPPLVEVGAFFSRVARGGGYWVTLFALSLPALALLWTGWPRASRDERRRVALLALGLVGCAGPTVAWVFAAEMWSSFQRVLPLRVAGFVLYPLLLLLPVWTTYVVRVHHALDVRLVARRAIQYAFARQTAFVLTLVPFAALTVEVYNRRSLSLAALLGGPAGVSLGALALLGVVALRGRKASLDWLDRRYFREQYDARRILAELVERCRRARSRDELAEALQSKLASALHPESTHLLIRDTRAETFTAADGSVQPLELRRPLLQLAESQEGAFATDLELPESAAARLPEEDRTWLADCGAKVCVPLKHTDGLLLGLLLLGDKKSDLPYSREDREWLGAVGAAAALGLSTLLADDVRRSGDPDPAGDAVPLALECVRCGSIHAPSRTQCERCAGALEATDLPLVVAGKFRLIKRLGDGAMGVVYRGIDIQLSRAVAIKTLPRLNPASASRLRREARVIASVSHPNLASIYGVESWRGKPMLVLELLSGGTLTDRIAGGPIPSAEVLQYGVSLAQALEAMHRAGILHRDVKPSNIGFTADGVPKLLDFGVSRLLGRAADEDPGDSAERVDVRTAITDARENPRMTTTADGRIVGTPLYLSPESLNGERPHPAFDVWSLCVVLYEAMAGQHPLHAPTVAEVLWRISRCDVPSIHTYLPGADDRLAAFFSTAFAADKFQRPRSAAALAVELKALIAG